MYVDGHMLTKPSMDRVSPGPLGVRVCKRDQCFEGYTLFSSAFGYTEYLVDLNGMVVHTWPVTKSQLAEIRPNGNLLVDRYEQGRKIVSIIDYHYYNYRQDESLCLIR